MIESSMYQKAFKYNSKKRSRIYLHDDRIIIAIGAAANSAAYIISLPTPSMIIIGLDSGRPLFKPGKQAVTLAARIETLPQTS